MKLKAVILAAGEGSRLMPFSDKENPKVLIPFLGKPLVFYHIDECLENGISEIVLVCNPWNLIKIKKLVGISYPKIRFDFVVQKELLGPAQAVIAAYSKVKDSDFFILKYADSLNRKSLLPILLALLKKKVCDGAVFFSKVEEYQRFGMAKFFGDKVVQIIEKPQKNPPSAYAWRGVSILSPKKFKQGWDLSQKHKDKKEVAPPEYVLRAKGNLVYRILDFENFDLGYPWDILTFNRLILEKFGGVMLAKRIGKNARISKKSFVSADTILEDNVWVGDYVSLDGAYVSKNTSIQDSYVMEGTKIGQDCIIKKSVIGKKVLIGNGFKTRIKSRARINFFVKGEYKETEGESLGCFLGDGVNVASNLSAYPGRVVYPKRKVKKNIQHDILPIRALLIDADNTLYNSKEMAKVADLKVMEYLACNTAFKADQLYQIWQGEIVSKLRESKKPKERHRIYSYGKLIQKLSLKIRARKAFNIFLNELGENLNLMPHLKEVLEDLKDYKKVVVSEDSQDLILYKLKKLGLEKYCDAVVCADEVGTMKPDDRYYKIALEKVNVLPQQAVMIGDSFDKDLILAGKLGLRMIKFGESDGRADGNFRDWRKLFGILEEV